MSYQNFIHHVSNNTKATGCPNEANNGGDEEIRSSGFTCSQMYPHDVFLDCYTKLKNNNNITIK